MKLLKKNNIIALVLIMAITISAFANPLNVNAKKTNYKYKGKFRITFYCPSCNGGYQTSTGKRAKVGRTIAVDPRVIPYGTKVRIGGHIYVAEDCGGAIKGKRIDIFCSGNCNKKGVRYQKVWVKK